MTVDNNILMPEVNRLISEGIEVTLMARGRSMMPCIRDRKDNLVLIKADPAQLQVGDVVLAYAQGHYVVHRIVGIEGDMLTLKGDGNLRGTEKCMRTDVSAMLSHVERNGRRIDCNTPAYRCRAAIATAMWRSYLLTRAAAGKALRILGIRKKI